MQVETKGTVPMKNIEVVVKFDIAKHLKESAKRLYEKGEIEFDSYFTEELKANIAHYVLYSIMSKGPISEIVEKTYRDVEKSFDEAYAKEGIER